MDWTTIITSIASLLLGGGAVGLFTLRQTKQGMAIDNATKVVEKYAELIEHYKSISEENQKKVEELTDEVNELKKEQALANTKIENLQLLYNNANYLRCNNLNCALRTPPINKDVLKLLLATSAEKEEQETEEE